MRGEMTQEQLEDTLGRVRRGAEIVPSVWVRAWSIICTDPEVRSQYDEAVLAREAEDPRAAAYEAARRSQHVLYAELGLGEPSGTLEAPAPDRGVLVLVGGRLLASSTQRTMAAFAAFAIALVLVVWPPWGPVAPDYSAYAFEIAGGEAIVLGSSPTKEQRLVVTTTTVLRITARPDHAIAEVAARGFVRIGRESRMLTGDWEVTDKGVCRWEGTLPVEGLEEQTGELVVIVGEPAIGNQWPPEALLSGERRETMTWPLRVSR